MKPEELFLEYSQEPKSEELVPKVVSLRAEALAGRDADLYLKSTLLLQEIHLYLDAPDEAVKDLREALDAGLLEDLKTLLSLSDKLVGILLKTEDFPALEAVLTQRERFLAGNPAQSLVQSFYWAVCLEGLRKYPEAIAVLEGIGDGISNNNLVSKYLKLAMLRLRTGEPEAARKAFEHAVLFDKNRKNEMFHLVESDLLAAEGDPAGALRNYQEFFLKTKSKNRYADRFITLNVALGNYEEAWKFYKEYAPRLMTGTSKNYRYQFHQAGLRLAEAMKKPEEAAEIKEKMLSVYEDRPVLLETFDGVRALFAETRKKTVFAKERDIYLESFRALDRILELPGLFFLRPREGELTFYHPKKGLLLESKPDRSALAKTVIGKILADHAEYSVFSAEDLASMDPFTPDPVALPGPMACVMAFAIPLEAAETGYLGVFLDADARFDFVNKMLFTLKAILETRLGYFFRLDAAREETRALQRLGALENRGFAKIVGGNVYLLNETAKTILGSPGDMMPFEAFQSLFQSENPLYLDRLVRKDSWNLPLRDFSGRAKRLEMRTAVENLHVYLTLRDVTEETERLDDLTKKAQLSALFPLWNMHRFLEDYGKIQTQTALMAIRFAETVFARDGYSHGEFQKIQVLGQEALRKAAGSHAAGIYLADDGTLLVLLSTTDRRVIDRLFADFRTATHSASRLVLSPSALPAIAGAAVNLLKGKTMEGNLDHLYAALSRATAEEPLVYYDREMALSDSRTEAVGIALEPLLATGNLTLRYRQAGNLETRKTELFLAFVSGDSLPFGETEVREALVRLHAESRLFLAAFRRLVTDVKQFRETTNLAVPFALAMPAEVLSDPAIADEIVRLPKRLKVPASAFLLVFRPRTREALLSAVPLLSSLREKGFAAALEDAEGFLTVGDFAVLAVADFLFLSKTAVLRMPPGFLAWMTGEGGKKILVRNVDTEEDARALKSFRVPRMEGKIFPSDLDLPGLIALASR